LQVPRSLREIGPMRIATAVAVVIAALLAAWSQWQPQRSVDASQEALALLSSNPHAALRKAQTAVSRDPLSAQVLFTLATIQQDAGQSALARATLQRAVRLQPSNPETWLTLARYDLAREPAVALKELQAGIYLNPELIAPEAIAPPYPSPESVEIYNDYVQALRASTTPSAAAPNGAFRAGRRLGAGDSAGGSAGAATSASERLSPAAAAARRAALRRRALRRLETETPRAIG
jgi:tetratricopeptide (TPR) repeat protein